MKRRAFIQSVVAGSAGLSFSLTAGAITKRRDPFGEAFPALQTFEFETVTVDRSGAVTARRQLEARYFREDLGGDVGLDMVALDRRPFLMGAASWDRRRGQYECTQHCSQLEPIFMGKTAVTQDQWAAVARLPRVVRELELAPSCFEGGDHPVECVSWHDAQEFCARLSRHTGRSYRLPTEAEWEGACRAGTTTPFHYGQTLTAELANYGSLHAYDAERQGNYRRSTMAVAQFNPNDNGLYDMHGNVWEWCADPWRDAYRGSPDTAAMADADRRTLRGGSWADAPAKLRSAARSGYDADSLNRIIGFRVCLSLDAA